MVPSAYVHIPFCDSICAYCDFVRIQKNEQFFSLWKEKLIQEIQEYKISNLHTLYFGGGTPSVLSLDDFASIRNCFPKDIDEFTVECNPESLDEEKLASYVSLGVNRISLGVQSFNDDLLKVCRRRHTSNQAKNVIRWIQESGIHNFSIDLIFGLPNQTMEDVKRDISTFLSLDIPHLSIYSLQIEENSIFGKTGVEPIDSDLEADMFESNQNSEPFPGIELTPTFPFIFSAIMVQMESPRPVPCLKLFSLTKRSNTSFCFSGGMPQPVSRTKKRILSSCGR